MNDFQSLFNPVGVQAVQTVKNSEVYKVSYKNGINGVYKSIIRFVPFPQNTTKCVMSKYVTWLTNPTTGQGQSIDDPKSIGQFSPATDLFFQLWNTKDPFWQKYAREHISTREQYASIIQIIQDEQHPELVGQFKVFLYGKTIHDKLYAEEHPTAGVGINPFHPIYGRYFSIVCESKKNYNNFDKCMFFDNKDNTGKNLPCGLWYINPATNKMEYVTEQSDQQAVFEYLNTNCPDLNKYDYHPWTAEQEQYVTDVLTMIRQYFQTGVAQSASQATYQSNMQVVNTPSGITMNANPVFPGVTNNVANQPVMNTSGNNSHIGGTVNTTQFNNSVIPNNVQVSTVATSSSVPNISGVDLPNTVMQSQSQTNTPIMGLSAKPSIGSIDYEMQDI